MFDATIEQACPILQGVNRACSLKGVQIRMWKHALGRDNLIHRCLVGNLMFDFPQPLEDLTLNLE